ncbi:MAG: DUF2065 domain-containing protein [Rhizobiaceae bacterium]
MADFIAAIGLVLVIEGIFYGGFPRFAKRMAAEASNTPEEFLRIAGLVAIAVGVAVVWMVRG